MLYVLVNFHLDLKRSRGKGMHHRGSREGKVAKVRDKGPTAHHTPAQNGSTLAKSDTGVRYGSSRVSQEFVFRRTL